MSELPFQDLCDHDDPLASALGAQGRFEEAHRKFEKAIAAVPDDPVILDHYGDVLAALGRDDEARAAWKRAAELDPENPQVQAKIRAK